MEGVIFEQNFFCDIFLYWYLAHKKWVLLSKFQNLLFMNRPNAHPCRHMANPNLNHLNITKQIIWEWCSVDLLTGTPKVRVPAERIKMYSKKIFVGPNDIALVKLRESVTLIPGRIAPVAEILTSPVNTCLQACLDHQGKIQDTETAAVVQGCSNINLFEMQ